MAMVGESEQGFLGPCGYQGVSVTAGRIRIIPTTTANETEAIFQLSNTYQLRLSVCRPRDNLEPSIIEVLSNRHF
jgi:hypothetical protein